MKRWLTAVAATTAALACAAPAQAATVSWWTSIRSSSSAEIAVTADPGEVNDVEVLSDEVAGYAKEVTVIDHGATLRSGTMPPPGSCGSSGCSVPCRIVSDHEARCSIADGFTDPGLPGRTPGFYRAYVRLGDGDDSFRSLPGIGFAAQVDGGAGSNHVVLGAGGVGLVGGNDVVEFGPGALGSAIVMGPGTLLMRDGTPQSVECRTSDFGRVQLDPGDTAHHCAFGPLGSEIVPPVG